MGSTLLTVTPENSKIRLDQFLSGVFTDLTRSRIKKLIGEGHVTVNGSSIKAGVLLRAGDVVAVSIPEPERSEILPEDIPLKILYEDGNVIVIDKPPHMVVHPAHGHYTGTVVNALLYHCRDLSGIGGIMRPGIVHRLDKGTSGVMVAAKNDTSHRALSIQFKEHTVGRAYVAAVRGSFREDRGRIDKPLARHSRDRKRIAVRSSGRRAVTDYEVLGRRGGLGFLRLIPGTGRTHQLRVHLASSGHPILGDTDYGGGVSSLHFKEREVTELLRRLSRPALHAMRLEFDHPVSKKRMAFESPYPEDLAELFHWITGGKG